MLKTFWQVAWRAGLLLTFLVLGWQLLYRLPLVQAKAGLQDALDKTSKFSETSNLLIPLNNMDLSVVKIRDHASVKAYYEEARFAKETAQKNLELANEKVDLTIWGILDPGLGDKTRSEISSYNTLAEDLKPIYQQALDLFSYYEASYLALYNLFYYDPQVDFANYQQSLDYDYLVQSYGVTKTGLLKTADKLAKLPEFDGDQIKTFIPHIKDLAEQAGEVSDVASTDVTKALSLAKTLAEKITILQNTIFDQRRTFWQGNKVRADLAINLTGKMSGIANTKSGLQLLLNKISY